MQHFAQQAAQTQPFSAEVVATGKVRRPASANGMVAPI
jgi:hypothetical protein